MRRFALAFLSVFSVVGALIASPALATLKPGDAAPNFIARAAIAGRPFTFALSAALRHGPVVVYFYPKAFTTGCSLEAHAFAEAIGKFEDLGASIIGVSHDDIATLAKFSKQDCVGKFPVASDVDQKIMTAYDAVLGGKHPELANRTSYLVAPDGHVIATYTDLDYSKHVDTMLAALATWKAGQH